MPLFSGLGLAWWRAQLLLGPAVPEATDAMEAIADTAIPGDLNSNTDISTASTFSHTSPSSSHGTLPDLIFTSDDEDWLQAEQSDTDTAIPGDLNSNTDISTASTFSLTSPTSSHGTLPDLTFTSDDEDWLQPEQSEL